MLVDIISKNGVLLLNIAPKADGSIHVEQQKMLHETGRWLIGNGEAVYASRPWRVHFQGDEPHFYAKEKSFANTYAKYDGDDFRFTRSKSGETLFVFAMGSPTEDFVVQSLTRQELSK